MQIRARLVMCVHFISSTVLLPRALFFFCEEPTR
jgi:hypothetical protein